MSETKQTPAAILWVIAAVQFLTPFMFSAIGVALPTIGREFSAGAVQLGLIEMVYILAVALLLLPIGRFADIKGRRRVFLSGTVLLTLATLALATAPTITLLIVFRFVQGIGAAMITSTSFAILTSVFPPEKRGRAMGTVVGCVYLGISAGPTLAGLMIDYLGWRWIFYSAVPVEILILLFASTRLAGEWADSRGEPFDWIGSLLYVIALGGLVTGILETGKLTGAGWLAVGGAAMLAIFLIYENRTTYPIFPLRKILANRIFVLSNIATWLNYAASFGIMFFFSIFLQVIKGISPKHTGFIMITQPLLQAVCAPLAGKMADKYNPAPIATLGMAFCTIGLVASATITAATPLIFIFAVLIVMGIGFGFFSTPNTAAIMASIDRRDYGMASSLIATMRTTGMLAAMTLITLLLSRFLGTEPVNPATGNLFLSAMHAAMVIFSLLGCAAILCSIGRTRRTPSQPTCIASEKS